MLWAEFILPSVKDEVERACSTHGEEENAYRVSVAKSKEKGLQIGPTRTNAHIIYSKTCPRRNRKGPNIFSKLGNFPHYTKLQKKKKKIENQLKYCMVYSTCL
jgi:hypothetical protein